MNNFSRRVTRCLTDLPKLVASDMVKPASCNKAEFHNMPSLLKH